MKPELIEVNRRGALIHSQPVSFYNTYIKLKEEVFRVIG